MADVINYTGDLPHYVLDRLFDNLCYYSPRASLQHPAVKTPQKVAVDEHPPSASSSDESVNVKVKENRPQTPEVATVKQETTPERSHRRSRSNLTDSRNVLESTTNGSVESPGKGSPGKGSPSKGRRRARDDAPIEKEAIPKKKVCYMFLQVVFVLLHDKFVFWKVSLYSYITGRVVRASLVGGVLGELQKLRMDGVGLE